MKGKRTLAGLLSVLMITSLIQVPALASETGESATKSSGTTEAALETEGTEDNHLVSGPLFTPMDSSDDEDDNLTAQGVVLNYETEAIDMSDGVDPLTGLLISDSNLNLPGLIAAKTASLPARYVAPDEDDYPLVKNQNPYGTCWTFGSTICAEASILFQEGIYTDLSELQLAYTTYSQVTDPLGGTEGDDNTLSESADGDFLEAGGNYYIVMGSYAGWKGAVTEEDVPYSEAAASRINGIDETYYYEQDAAHLRNAYYFDLVDDREYAKEAIQKYGAIGVMYYENAAYYNTTNNAYYCDLESVNHAVSVVGWDDNFSKDNFSTTEDGNKPENNGAWLIRNSWGSDGDDDYDEKDYCHNGYFWISYEDVSLNLQGSNSGFAFDFVSSASEEFYDNNYQYDGSNYSGYVGYNNTKEGSEADETKAANVFTVAKTAEELEAVMFGTASSNVSYTVDIYKNLTYADNPESGTKVATQTGNAQAAGLYTVKLDEAISFIKGDTFSVVVSLKEEGTDGAILLTETSADFWFAGTTAAKAGQSFFYNENLGYYVDYGDENDENIRIKAFTNTVTDGAVTGVMITPDSDAEELFVNETLKLDKTVSGASETEVPTNKKVTWTSSDPTVAIVSKTGLVKALKAGTTTITVTTEDGNKTDSLVLTVKASDIARIEIETDNIISEGEALVGYTGQLVAKAYDADGAEIEDAAITLASCDSNVATVSAGEEGIAEIEVKSIGVANIVATAEGVSAALTFTVLAPDYTIKAECTTEGTVKITWPIYSTSVATVIYRLDEDGNYIAGDIGQVDNTGTYVDKKASEKGVASYEVKLWYNCTGTDFTTIQDCDIHRVKVIFKVQAAFEGDALEWDEIPSADQYEVYQREVSDEYVPWPSTPTYETVLPFCTLENLENGKAYEYKVYAVGVLPAEIHELRATYLSAPNVTAQIDMNSVNLSWDANSAATGYKIYRKSEGDADWTFLKDQTRTTYTDKDLASGFYIYRVIAYCSGGESRYEAAYATVLSKVTVKASVANGSITLNWNQEATAKGYYIYRKAGNGAYEKLATIAKNDTLTYTDSNITSGITYTYYVQAYCGLIKSPYVETLAGTATATAVVLSKITTKATVANGSITLSWNKDAGAAGYYIYRKAGTGSYKKLATISKNSTLTYKDKALTNGTKYTYYVQSYKGSIVSPYTASKAGTATATAVILNKVTAKLAVASGSIKLTWNQDANATGYKIYRKTGSGSYTLLATIKKAATTSYTDKTVKNGKTYTYYVQSYKGKLTGTYKAASYLYLTTPAFSKATSTTAGKITLKWKKNTSATGYQIKYVKGTTTKTVKITKAATVSKVLTKLTKGSTYKVYIRAYKTVGKATYYSAYSSVSKVKVKK